VLSKYHANGGRVKLALKRMRAHIAFLALVMAASGCIEIDGGAVELSWSLRSFDGEPVDSCTDARIERVRICWQSVADGASTTGACDASQAFPCEEENGVSGFEIAPGATAFWAEPICVDGEPADPDTYQVPPPIVRSVEEGQIVTLNSLLIVVTPLGQDCPDAGCTCVRQ
jgi:hypothetical protein